MNDAESSDAPMKDSHSSNSYSEKLKDPRWQKKRLEVMQRDEFTCQVCFDSSSTLNVHHNYYIQGAAPWDYPLDALVTMCEDCHKNETNCRRQEEETLLKALRLIGFKASHINGLYSALFHAFGDSPIFSDNSAFYLDRYIFNFFRIAKDADRMIAAKKKLDKLKNGGE